MNALIQKGDELMEHFFLIGRKSNQASERLQKGVFVNGKVRKDILTSCDQGRIVIEGTVKNIEFENTGGGVYRAFVSA